MLARWPANSRRLTCAPKCRVAAHRKGESTHRGRRKCEWCGKWYLALRQAQRCCERKCQWRALNRRATILRLKESGWSWSRIAAHFETTEVGVKRLSRQ